MPDQIAHGGESGAYAEPRSPRASCWCCVPEVLVQPVPMLRVVGLLAGEPDRGRGSARCRTRCQTFASSGSSARSATMKSPGCQSCAPVTTARSHSTRWAARDALRVSVVHAGAPARCFQGWRAFVQTIPSERRNALACHRRCVATCARVAGRRTFWAVGRCWRYCLYLA